MNANEIVVVTGASGFIGSHLVRALAETGKRVRCLVRKTSKTDQLKGTNVEFAQGDVTDLDSVISAVRGVQTVYHLAGLTKERRVGDFIRVNRNGCANVAAACLRSAEETGNAPTLLYLSSLAASGPAQRACSGEEPLVSQGDVSSRLPYRLRVETMLPRPISPYGKSKLAGEQETLQYADRIPISILRPPFVFGEEDFLSLPVIRMAKVAWRFPLPGYFDQYYSFLHVSDLVSQMIALENTSAQRASTTSLAPIANSSEGGKICSGQGIYFAGRKELWRMSHFINEFAQAAGRKKIKMFYCPPVGVLGTGLVMEGWRRVTGRQVPLDWNKAIEAIRGPWISSPEKIIEFSAFVPTESLEEQIQRTYRWYQEQGIL